MLRPVIAGFVDIPGISSSSAFWTNVKNYGAIGDGVTDDSAAILAAYNVIPSYGGVLYFPSSSGGYKVTSGFTITKPITIMGDGGGGPQDNSTLARSTINFSTTTGTLFVVTTNGVTFEKLELNNPNTGTITAGAGISVTTNGESTLYNSITVNGFYINIDHQTGAYSSWSHVNISNPVKYGIKLQSTVNGDWGDWEIDSCNFLGGAKTTNASAIRVESGGGLKITNCKTNIIVNVAAFAGNTWKYGIDVNLSANVISGDFLLSNCSIEGWGTDGAGASFTAADGIAGWGRIVISGNQFGSFAATNNSPAIYFSTTNQGQYSGVVVEGNTAYATPASSAVAYQFNKVDNLVFSGNQFNSASFSNLVSYTSCNGRNYLGSKVYYDDAVGQFDWTGAAGTTNPGFFIQDASGGAASLGLNTAANYWNANTAAADLILKSFSGQAWLIGGAGGFLQIGGGFSVLNQDTLFNDGTHGARHRIYVNGGLNVGNTGIDPGVGNIVGNIVGTITNDSAASGNVGQVVSSLVAVGSPQSLSNGTATNVTNVSLTAGDWDVQGNVNFTETTSTITARSAGISSTSATLPTDGSECYCGVQSTVTSETNSITLPRKRISIASTTTIYLVAKATFSAGTCGGFGSITARRVR